MQHLFSVFVFLTFVITYIVSNMFWMHLRTARATGIILHNEAYLRGIITRALLREPPPHLGRYAALPRQTGFSSHMDLFHSVDRKATFGLWGMWRVALIVVVAISGILGCLSFGWLGLFIPIINFLIIAFKFNSSMTGEIGEEPIESAKENVQIKALIIHRWLRTNPEEIIEWTSANPHMQLLSKVVSAIDG